MNIHAINIGVPDVKVTAVGWKMRRPWRLKSAWGYQNLSAITSIGNPKLPARLEHGEEIQFWLPATGHQNWFAMIQEHGFMTELLKNRRDLGRLRAVVFTSVGKPSFSRPAAAVLDRIWEAQQVYREAR